MKFGDVIGFTVRGIATVWVRVPLVHVIVTVAFPVVALLAADRVRVVAVVKDGGLKLAVTPDGRPVALQVKVPANPPLGVWVIVLVPAAP